jgi:hypothetical protein
MRLPAGTGYDDDTMADVTEDSPAGDIAAAASQRRTRELSPGIAPLLVLSKIRGILDAFADQASDDAE